MDKSLLDALYTIDPSRLTYDEWKDVGMALKAEGQPCSVWDDWSRSDSARYDPETCYKKWETFEGAGVTGGTIFYLAKRFGYDPNYALDWDDGLDAYYEEVLTVESKPDEEPYQMTIRYLEAMFKPDEEVSFVNAAVFKEDSQKWVPADAGHVLKCSRLISKLKKFKNLDEAFGTINEEAGAWIRINPTSGSSNKDVTRYAYSLVESDSLPIEEQKKLLINMRLPIVAMVESGGKSVHAIVRVDAEDLAEYKQRVSFLYDWLSKHQFIVDEANKNPARLSRLPGAMRNGKIQKLIATNIGCASWLEWKDHIEGIDDDLPPLTNFWDQLKNPPSLTPELISGVLREGNKMIITGESKSGKTCLSQTLAVCIAEGKPWLGKFQCEQGRVLYMNLEVEEASLFFRFKRIYEACGFEFKEESCRNIVPWNLRGHAIPIDKLAAKVIRRCRNTGPYLAIILDPLYKVQQGDENSAEAITAFCNALDKIAHETGAAIIYDHHHAKGSAGDKKVIDRGSGSGVFSRDADAICDISFLDPSKEILENIEHQLKQGEKPMQMAFTLRDFKDIPEFNLFFKFPIHYIDTRHLLDGAAVEGSTEANLQKSPYRTTKKERKAILDQAFEESQENGIAKFSVMWKCSTVSDKTMKNYIEQFSEEYELREGYVRRISHET